MRGACSSLYRSHMPAPRDGRSTRIEQALAWSLLCVVGFLFAAHPSFDPDLPWHLRTGQLALERRSTLPVDPFSYTFAGAPWPYKDLVADVMFHLGSAALGRAFVPVLRFAFVFVFAAILMRVVAPRRPVIAAVIATLMVCGFGIAERPQLFGHALFLALLVAMDEAHATLAARRDLRGVLRALAPVVAIEWAWVWLHRSAIIGLALGLLFPLRLLLTALPLGSREARTLVVGPRVGARAIGAAAAAGVAAVALATLNPSGMAFFRSAINVQQSKMARALITEFQPIGLVGYFRAFPLGATLVVIALVAGATRLIAVGSPSARRRLSGVTPSLQLFHVALLATTTALLWDAARWLYFAALAAGLVVAHLSAEALQLHELAGARRLRGASALACLLAAAAAVFVAGPHVDLSMAEDPRSRPAGALAFAKAHGLVGRVATPLFLGGYVIQHAWPDVQPNIDGRNDHVYPPEFVMRVAQESEDPRAFEQAHPADGARWVLASNAPGRVTHRFLAADPHWMLVYWSDGAVIYVHADARPDLAPLRFDAFLDPDAVIPQTIFALQRGVDPQRVHAQLLRMVDASPTSVRALGALCIFYQRLGPTWRARRDAALAVLRATAPQHPIVRTIEAEVIAGGW